MKTFRPHPRLPDRFIIDTAGWVSRHASVFVGRSSCGKITDGIALDLCDGVDMKSPWHPGGVISFDDLEAIYLAAKAARAAQGKESTP